MIVQEFYPVIQDYFRNIFRNRSVHSFFGSFWKLSLSWTCMKIKQKKSFCTLMKIDEKFGP